jgi:rSAM/selenodomain-associated transferase 1
MGHVAVAVICKTPVAGQSKTRLSPPLRPEECAEISGCFIHDLASTIAGLPRASAQPYVVYTPAGSEVALQALLPPDFRLLLQGDGDLGNRLLHGIEGLLSAGHVGAMLINSDSPTLPPALLQAGILALEAGSEMVISPAFDGGYTFIGLRHPHRRLFEEIEWSTSTVFERTLLRAAEIGLKPVVLDRWYDIDDAASYAMLEAELAGRRPGFVAGNAPLRDAPMTRRFVERRRAAAMRDGRL